MALSVFVWKNHEKSMASKKVCRFLVFEAYKNLKIAKHTFSIFQHRPVAVGDGICKPLESRQLLKKPRADAVF